MYKQLNNHINLIVILNITKLLYMLKINLFHSIKSNNLSMYLIIKYYNKVEQQYLMIINQYLID